MFAKWSLLLLVDALGDDSWRLLSACRRFRSDLTAWRLARLQTLQWWPLQLAKTSPENTERELSAYSVVTVQTLTQPWGRVLRRLHQRLAVLETRDSGDRDDICELLRCYAKDDELLACAHELAENDFAIVDGSVFSRLIAWLGQTADRLIRRAVTSDDLLRLMLFGALLNYHADAPWCDEDFSGIESKSMVPVFACPLLARMVSRHSAFRSRFCPLMVDALIFGWGDPVAPYFSSFVDVLVDGKPCVRLEATWDSPAWNALLENCLEALPACAVRYAELGDLSDEFKDYNTYEDWFMYNNAQYALVIRAACFARFRVLQTIYETLRNQAWSWDVAEPDLDNPICLVAEGDDWLAFHAKAP